MDKKSTGPYQHYERPTKKRSSQDKQPRGSARWIAVIVILAVILITLIPAVHRLASKHSQKAEEVQTLKKVSSSSAKSSKEKKTSSSSAKRVRHNLVQAQARLKRQHLRLILFKQVIL